MDDPNDEHPSARDAEHCSIRTVQEMSVLSTEFGGLRNDWASSWRPFQGRNLPFELLEPLVSGRWVVSPDEIITGLNVPLRRSGEVNAEVFCHA